MNSLKEVLGALQTQDHVKEAEAQAAQDGVEIIEVDADLLKQAQDYDQIGRILAHHVYVDMVKEAVDDAMPDAPEEEKKEEVSKILAAARGEGESEEEKEKKRKEEEKKKAEGEGGPPFSEAEEEKKAAVKATIIQRMTEDPNYVAHLVQKHCE